MTAFHRGLWEAQLAAAHLPAGTVRTGLVLAAQADGQGVAVVKMTTLAELSGCALGTAHTRKTQLIGAGFVITAGRVSKGAWGTGGPVNRYQLAIPAIIDVGQWLSGPCGGGGYA